MRMPRFARRVFAPWSDAIAASEMEARREERFEATVKARAEYHDALLKTMARDGSAPEDYGLAARVPRPNLPMCPYAPPAGIIPRGQSRRALAFDDAVGGMFASVKGSYGVFTGQGFPGFPYLTELTQISEYRDMYERVAAEMCRKWIKFRGKGEDDKSERIGAIEDEFTRLEVRDRLRRQAEVDFSMGRGQLFANFGEDHGPELATQLMVNRFKINRNNKLKYLKIIEPLTTYPAAVDSDNPLATDFYSPRTWFVYGTEVHRSRLFTMVGRPLPDLLKPAYNFSGISLSQLAQPYVDYWLNTRDSIGEVLRNFSTVAMATNMDLMLSPTAPRIMQRLKGYSMTRKNNGVFLYDKTNEDIKLLNITLAGLDKLQAQAQEHQAAVAKTPLVVLLGITPTGLNQSAEGDMRVFYDYIADQQERVFRPIIEDLLQIVQLGLFNDIDPDITFDFVNLFSITGKEQALITKTTTDSDVALVTAGVVTPGEVRAKIARNPDSGYDNLDVNKVPPPPAMPPAKGFGGKGGGFDPEGQAQMNTAMNGSDAIIVDALENALGLEGAQATAAFAQSKEALEATWVLAEAGGELALDSAITSHGRALNAHKVALAAISADDGHSQALEALVDAHGSAIALLGLVQEALLLDEAAGHEFRGNQWVGGIGGVHSVGKGKDLTWVGKDGKPLAAADQARLKAMGTPPAWTNVRLNPDPKADIQVIGLDSKDRAQYLYSAEHSAAAAAEKFGRLKDFQKALPKIRSGIDKEMEKGNEAAAALSLIEKTGFRVGSMKDTGAEVDAFGASTLLGQHATVKGDTVTFDFVGKHGVDIHHEVTDHALAKYVRDRKKEDPEGRLFNASDQQVRDLLKKVSGNDHFKVKDFRTWHGTATALQALGGRKASDEKGFKALQKEVSTAVAEHLHNTPAIALKAYIAPEVWTRAKAGGF